MSKKVDWALIKAEEWLDRARESDGKEWSFDYLLLSDEIAIYLRALAAQAPVMITESGEGIIAKIDAFVEGADSLSVRGQLVTMLRLALLARDEIVRLRGELAGLKNVVAQNTEGLS